jgi:hemerythrin superfamily protein
MKRKVLLAVSLAAVVWLVARRRQNISRHLKISQMPSSGGRPRGPEYERGADVTAVIALQHQRVRELLEQVRQETGQARADAFYALRLILALHETAEEQAIHPQAQRQLGLYERAATDRIAEEQTAGQTIRALEMVDVDSDQFNATFDSLASSVTDHAAAEENDEWPALRQITDPPVIDAMAAQMQAVQLLAEDPSAPGINVTFADMQHWAKSRLPHPAES